MIVFREPQKQETSKPVPMEFNGAIRTLVGEKYCKQDIQKSEVVHPVIDKHFTDISEAKNKDSLNIKILHKEGEPFELQYLRKENDYNQYKPYIDNGNFIWEESLARDHKNDKTVLEAVELYGEDYIKLANGEKDEK